MCPKFAVFKETERRREVSREAERQHRQWQIPLTSHLPHMVSSSGNQARKDYDPEGPYKRTIQGQGPYKSGLPMPVCVYIYTGSSDPYPSL